MVYTHVHRIAIDKSKVNNDSPMLVESNSLQKVMTGRYWVCLLCKETGKPVSKCLRKMKAGDTSNTRSHLNEVHKERLAEIQEEEKVKMMAKTRKRKGGDSVGKAPKILKQQEIFMSCGKRRAPKMSPKQQKARDELHKLEFKFINNGGHADEVISDPNFRSMIDFAINNANLLQGFQHMGHRKYIAIQCSSFQEFTDKVEGYVNEIRQWYIKKTVRIYTYVFCQLFDHTHK